MSTNCTPANLTIFTIPPDRAIKKRGCVKVGAASFMLYVVRLVSYVGLVLGVVAVALNVYGIEKVIDAFHFFGSV